MPFELSYDLDDAGWAFVTIRDGKMSFTMRVSYLNDSLKELAEAAIAVRDGSAPTKVLFMDEPGETHLVVEETEGVVNYELRRFDDWNSWGRVPADKYEVVHQAQVERWEFLAEIRKQLQRILREHGAKGYRDKWIDHDFPMDLFDELVRPKK